MTTTSTENVTAQVIRLLDYLEGELLIDGYRLDISDEAERVWALWNDHSETPWTRSYTTVEVLAFIEGCFRAKSDRLPFDYDDNGKEV